MPKEWYVSFHGGKEESSLNNIHVYSTDGTRLRKALNKKSLPAGIKLRELRGFVFGPDQNLYVVNAYFEYSQILKFNGTLNENGQHDFAQVFVKRHAENPGIDHPFNLAFDLRAASTFRVKTPASSPDITVPGAKTGKPGTPMPLPESLHLEKADFPPGTFVPSAKLASNGLLEVRAVIFAPNNEMFVADRAADWVRIYEARTGRHLRNLGRKAISSIGRSIFCLVQTVVIFSLEAAGRIRFCDMIFGRAPRASLSSQSPRALMVPQEWHLATMVSSTLLVAIQKKFFVTEGSTADHAASLSSTTWRITRSF